MASIDTRNKAIISKGLPSAAADGESDMRLDQYRSVFMQNIVPKMHPLSVEGSYYTLTNPTPGTGIATIAAQATLADTAPFILFKNANAAGGKNIMLDYLKLICAAAGTGGTQLRYAVKVDGGGANRWRRLFRAPPAQIARSPASWPPPRVDSGVILLKQSGFRESPGADFSTSTGAAPRGTMVRI